MLVSESVAYRAPESGARLPSGFFLKAILLSIVLLQRFAISPGGFEIPVVLPVVLALIIGGFASGEFELHPTRSRLVIILAITAVVCSMTQVFTGNLPSLTSLALLGAIYTVAMFRSTGGREIADSVSRLYVAVMTGGAIIGLLQFVLQYVGIENVDYIAEILPDQFLVQGFAQNAFITYGSDLRRSNGVLFLEPSFLSLFLGLAVLVALRSGAGWIQITILAAGMVPTLAGNGLIVLIPGLVLLALSPYRRRLLALIPGLVAAVVAAFLTPLGQLYLGRSTEAGASGSSASFRFVQPYSTLLPASLDNPFNTLFGHGAGSSDTYLDGLNLFEITRPAIPKILFEYGVLGGVGILASLVVIFALGLRKRPWLIGIVVAYFFINASLLVSTLAFFTLFWTSLIPDENESRPDEHDRRPDEQPPELERPRTEVLA